MSAKPSTSFAAGEEASVMRQLELLLVPLHHRFRYPLPIPAHLTASATAGADSSSSAAIGAGLAMSASNLFASSAREDLGVSMANGDGTSASASPQEVEPSEAQQHDRLRRSALSVVEAQVPDLLPWQTRLQLGAVQAENCYQVLEHVRANVAAMQRVTESVQTQSDHLSHNASAMMVRKAKLELVREALEQNLAHFTHIDDLCREADNPFLKAGTPRFSALLQDIAKEMEFLSTNAQYKSAKAYAMRLAVAQQMVSATLKDAVRSSFRTMEATTTASPAFAAATHVLKDEEVKGGGGNVLAAAPAATKAAPTTSPTKATSSVASLPSASASLLRSPTKAAETLELRYDDVAGSFADFLSSVNDVFVKSGGSFTSLRRMAELRQGGFSYAGADAFGEEMLTATGGIEADPGMKEVLDTYRDARVGVVVPLLRYWLTLWYYLDAQKARQDATSAAQVEQAQQQLHGGAQQHLGGVTEAHTLPQLAEHICGLLQRSLCAESDVLNRVWLRDDITSYLLPKLVSSIAEEVYYAFRSRLLCVDDVGELAQTVESIQRVSLRQNTGVSDTEVVSDLWMRMIQDTQERLVFRTSVHLRQTVARSTPTREIAAVYLRCGTGAYTATADTEAATKMFYIPGVIHALQLLHWLYPTLEFSVFSVFAEEAVHHSLELIRLLVKLMRQMDSTDVLRDTKAYLCQLAHLQHVETELSHVDANITVVERRISFAGLRQRRLELEQSSRESKKEVQVDLIKCSEHLTTAMLALVTQPMSGAAKKTEAERTQLVAEMKGRVAGVRRMIDFYVEHGETRQDLVHILHERSAELAAEVGVDINAVAATPVTAATTTSVVPSAVPPVAPASASPNLGVGPSAAAFPSPPPPQPAAAAEPADAVVPQVSSQPPPQPTTSVTSPAPPLAVAQPPPPPQPERQAAPTVRPRPTDTDLI